MEKFNIEREEYINKTFKIPVKLIDQMNKICDSKNVSLNKLVVKCIEYALDNSDIEINDKKDIICSSDILEKEKSTD